MSGITSNTSDDEHERGLRRQRGWLYKSLQRVCVELRHTVDIMQKSGSSFLFGFAVCRMPSAYLWMSIRLSYILFRTWNGSEKKEVQPQHIHHSHIKYQEHEHCRNERKERKNEKNTHNNNNSNTSTHNIVRIFGRRTKIENEHRTREHPNTCAENVICDQRYIENAMHRIE